MNCKIIEDLLPLYHDDLVSAESRELIEGHLKTCESCKLKLAGIGTKIRTPIHDSEKSFIRSLKNTKHKLFRKNVIIAITSSLVAITVLVTGFSYAYFHETPLKYSVDILNVRGNTTETWETDGVTQQVPCVAIEYLLSGDCHARYNSQFVEIDGKNIEVLSFHYSLTPLEHIFKKSKIDGKAEVITYLPYNSETDGMEIYYVDKNLNKLANFGTPQEYYAECQKGQLIWKGDNPNK